MADRVWYIFTDMMGHYTIAKEATGSYMHTAGGPFTWEEAVAWMKSQGVPGF